MGSLPAKSILWRPTSYTKDFNDGITMGKDGQFRDGTAQCAQSDPSKLSIELETLHWLTTHLLQIFGTHVSSMKVWLATAGMNMMFVTVGGKLYTMRATA